MREHTSLLLATSTTRAFTTASIAAGGPVFRVKRYADELACGVFRVAMFGYARPEHATFSVV